MNWERRPGKLIFQLERSQDTAGTPTAPLEGLAQEMAGDESSLINSAFPITTFPSSQGLDRIDRVALLEIPIT